MCSTPSTFARVMPPRSRTGSQCSEKRTDSCGSRNPYVSWFRKSPACSSTYALSSSESAVRHVAASRSLPHDQNLCTGNSEGSATWTVPLLVFGW